MKIRTGYVSNSSSQSFVISKGTVDEVKKYILDNLNDFINKHENRNHYGYSEDEPLQGWSIDESSREYSFLTFMNNFAMDEFLADNGFIIEENEEY